jgi:hypothetical protein
LSPGVLHAAERQVHIFVLPERSNGASLALSWEDSLGSNQKTLSMNLGEAALDTIVLPDGKMPSSKTAAQVIAHVLRLQVAAALATLAVGDDVSDRFDALHDAVLNCLSACQLCTESREEEADEQHMVFLEGMLQSLERDLGEALADRSSSRERKGVLLSFAHEHFHMHSASSLTRCRTAYASRQQIELRLRFLQSSAAAHDSDAKTKCSISDGDPSEDERQCRQALDDQVCFVTLGGWRDCVLGLGLFVHPRTVRERRKKLPPQVDLVVDYVSAEAYNLGVRTMVQHAVTELPGQEEDEEENADDVGTRPDALPSSTRRRINAWLPLYINEANWSISKTFAPSAFSLIATQLNAAFQPQDALKVCARLMCCAIVGFMHPVDESKRQDDIVHGHQRAKASDRAIQMYCDVHRLFHAMAKSYPEIKKAASAKIQAFIESPEERTRQKTPDLGNLIVYLSILDEFSWVDLAPTFVPEMLRRAVARFVSPLEPTRCDSVADIISRFDELEPEHGLVTLFNKVFNDLVARPTAPWDKPTAKKSNKPMCCSDVCEMYNRRWGQLPSERRSMVFKEIQRMRAIQSVAGVLRELLPFRFDDDDVGELILWAVKNGHSNKPMYVGLDLQKMPRTLTKEWEQGVLMRRKLEREARQALSRPAAHAMPHKVTHSS